MARLISFAVFQMTPGGYERLYERSADHAGVIAMAKGGAAPAAPDPQVQAAAEGAQNRVDEDSPTGSIRYSQGEREITGFDSRGAPIYGVRATKTTSLSPEAQKQFDTSNRIADTLLGGAEKQTGELANTPFKFNVSGPQSNADLFQYSGDQPKAAADVYNRQIALLRPEFDRNKRDLEQKLANQGLPLGSDAYNEQLGFEKDRENFALNDAAYQAEDTGYQRFNQDRSAQLAGRQQQQNEVGQSNNQQLQERQQRYNEIASALGGDQILPVGAFGGNGGPQIDVSGAFQGQQDSALAKYNAGQARRAGNVQAGGTLAAAGIGAAVIF